MKICFLSSFYYQKLGGAEISGEIIIDSLRDQGHRVEVVTAADLFGNKIFSFELIKKIYKLGWNIIDRHLSKKIKDYLKDIDPDVLWINDRFITPAGVRASKIAGCPTVVTVRESVKNDLYDILLNYPFSFLVKRRNETIVNSLKKCHKIIAISRYIRNELIDVSIPKEKILQIYNPLPNWKLEKTKYNVSNFRVLALGRITWSKGFETAIRAVADISKNFDIELVIVGGGPDKARLESLIQKLEINRYVKLIGKIASEEIKKEYLKSDVVVFPTTIPEPLGRVAIEAAFLEKPIIASKVGGIPELVEDGTTGKLIEPNNPVALRNAIIEFIDNPDLKKEMGREARKHILKLLDRDSIVNSYVKVFESVTRARRVFKDI